MRGIQEVKKTPFSPCLSFTVPRLDPEVRLWRPRHSQGDSKKLSNGRAPGAQSSPPPADDDDAQVDGPSEDGAAGLADLHLIPKKRCTSLSGVNSYIFFSCTSRIRPHCYFYEKQANTIFL
uniref:Uncharacterized protein n=1 Tax=Triticum urartu TaxID=4572 RepID=A0A8R7P0G6_TRIUA